MPSHMMELDEERDKMLDRLLTYCMNSVDIDPDLYRVYDVKRGLRDRSGRGVLTGLTEISDVVGTEGEERTPVEGSLYYQGYNVNDILKGREGQRFKFEEVTYLLLFGALPTERQLDAFLQILTDLQELSGEFTRDVIMKAPSANIMNSLQKSIITLYSYDNNPEDTDLRNVLRQALQLIAKMPLIAIYSYHAYHHMYQDESLFIRNPKKEFSTAENILRMLRPDGKFSPLEAEVLDVALVLHAEHGGGNNSTFTTHVVTSSGTDTYSATAASIASLKGPKHGGANLKVLQMFKEIKANVKNWDDKQEVADYLEKILSKQAFDRTGLIYGMGHAVYTISDPREVALKEYTRRLAEEKGRMDEFRLYENVENISKKIIMQHRHTFKPVCANVDFYSGFLYSMLGIPEELFTPIFAIARISGWSAHRLEELGNDSKIIRPAYKYVGHHRDYLTVEEREV